MLQFLRRSRLVLFVMVLMVAGCAGGPALTTPSGGSADTENDNSSSY